MMAVLATILPVVSRSSSLAYNLYRSGAESQESVKDFITIASVINEFASILKQVGTIIKEDDRLPSHEAIETLEDIVDQSQAILADVEAIAFFRDDSQHTRNVNGRLDSKYSQEKSTVTKLAYLATHLGALRMTLSVLLQTLYTAQSIIWSRLRPTISPQQAATAVANEQVQLEALIIEQQMSILTCSMVFKGTLRNDNRLLMEADSSQSLIATHRGDTTNPGSLFRYQVEYIANLDTSESTKADQLRAVCDIASSQSERLLERWTRLPQFDDRLRDAEREIQKQKQENQQATVESDSEDEHGLRRGLAGNGARVTSKRPESVQPLFSDAHTSPRNSRSSFSASINEQYSPTSPRSSNPGPPVKATAAMEAKEEDGDSDLEIPWTLWTGKYYWEHIDAKLVKTNDEQRPPIVSRNRSSWTEIMASWVCKEAIAEAGFEFTQVQKDMNDSRRTTFETCFHIKQALQFYQVKHLVERTVEIYRKTAPSAPLPQVRGMPYKQSPSSPPRNLKMNGPDRDRTPMARKTHAPLDRSMSSMPINSYPPPPLDRSLSLPGPGPGLRPPPPPPQHLHAIPYAPTLQIPIPSGSIAPPPPPRAQSPHSPYAQAGLYSAQTMGNSFQQFGYASMPQYNQSTWSTAALPLHTHAQVGHSSPHSPLRQSFRKSSMNSKYDDTTTSDSESGERERSRRHRSKSRNRHASSKKKSRHGTSKAVGTLMGVGGLTALLDGLSGL
ncbi:hypothetical protein BKA66DRAFT_429360 [Pyrenochaeta sp. MPI-SDFR-AT-0127]|nr:hypothetical protein BKA66DRAFT_429360 [Pyrenochaeta sp. MPI-SDFR-AT-0127]